MSDVNALPGWRHPGYYLGFLMAAILLMAGGCASVEWTDNALTTQTDHTQTSLSQCTEDKPPATSAPTSGVSPVPKVTGSAVSEETDESLQEKWALAPEIEGTEKVISAYKGLRRVIYQTLPGNPYQMDAGLVAGVYKHEVFTGDRQTGGVALAAPLAARLLDQALAEMPQDPRWLVTLPLDLSDCQGLAPVTIELSAKPFIDRPYYILVTADSETVSVVSILDQSQETVIDLFKMYGMHYVISKTSNDHTSIIPGQEMAFLFIVARFAEAPADRSYTFGDRIGWTSDSVLTGLTTVRGPVQEHDYSCLLRIGGCPVFLMANPDP